MKPIFFFLRLFVLFILLPFTAHAQTDLYSGGWTTSNTELLTTIAASSTLASKVYRIDCTTFLDANILEFNVIVDGVKIPSTFFEGGYVIVEGKTIFIQQITSGKLIKGSWKVLQQAEMQAEKSLWVGYPKINKEILVASLKTEQEFVLSINASSPDCTDTSMVVSIDNVPVKDLNNKIITFAAGSSVVGKGKTITIKVTGNCTANNPINGDLRILKNK